MTEQADTRKPYLTFGLGHDVFALGVDTVREVLEMMPVTAIPRTPRFMLGVVNLRGRAVPVVDLRLQFGLPVGEDTVETCIIIVEVDFMGERNLIGGVADSVREVVDLNPEAIEPPPSMGTSVSVEFIQGIARQGDGFVIILDIEQVFSARELSVVGSTGAAAGSGVARPASAIGPVPEQTV
jgi:purine-binding chemotaxis protein CheW